MRRWWHPRGDATSLRLEKKEKSSTRKDVDKWSSPFTGKKGTSTGGEGPKEAPENGSSRKEETGNFCFKKELLVSLSSGKKKRGKGSALRRKKEGAEKGEKTLEPSAHIKHH